MEQVISVTSHELEHLIFGESHSAEGAVELADYASSTYMLTTTWSQNSPYNKYCPIDPVTKQRSVAGCTNTAAAQIINYWESTGLLDFSLTISSSDNYSKNGITVSSNSYFVSRFGYLSFDETNNLLQNYKLNDINSIAALCFAAGVVQQAGYGSDGTSTSWSIFLFMRSGFKNTVLRSDGGSAYFYSDYGMKTSGYNLLKSEVLAGRPVGISIKYAYGKSEGEAYHALVVDGYDSSTDKFHLNFGWGGLDDGWYSPYSLNYDYGIYQFVTGITPKVSPRLKVTGLAFAQDAVNLTDTISVSIDISNVGTDTSTSTTAYVYCGTKLLKSVSVSFISPHDARTVSCTISASLLSQGAQTITVQINSQNEDGSVYDKTGVVKVYDGAVTDGDDTWEKAHSGDSKTKTTVAYYSSGQVKNADLAAGEYVGYYDMIDFRELTVGYAGKYSISLTGGSNKLELTISTVNTSTGKLKDLKKVTIAANKTEGGIYDLLLEKGVYYVSVKASNWKNHGDSDYQLTVSGNGFAKADNSDDWSDVKTAGPTGAVGDVGNLTAPKTVISDGWVGYGDAVDYKAFTLLSAASVSFTVKGSDATKFTISQLVANKNGTYTLKSLQSTALVKPKDATEYSAATKELLLDKGTYYFAVESTNARSGGSSAYSVALNSNTVFYTAGDNSDDDWQTVGLPKLAAGGLLSEWVGFGDRIDYRALKISPVGGFYNFELFGVENNVKLTVYSLDAKTNKLKQVKSVTATAKKNDVFTGRLCLNGSTKYYLAVEAPGAARAQNSIYGVSMTNDGIFNFLGNETLDEASILGAGINGLLTTAAGGDKTDCFDLLVIDSLKLDATQGKVKVSFYGADKKAVKVASMTMADGTVKKNVSGVTLVAGNKTTDNFTFAVGDAVRYLKIEAAANNINTYSLVVLA